MDTIPVKYVDDYETIEYESAKWLKIFHHNASEGNYFDEDDAKFFLGNETVTRFYKYSILKYFPFIKTYEKGVYEFILYYPTLKNENNLSYNRWKQTSNPCLHKDVEGYQPINITWDNGSWIGLHTQGQMTYICGSNTAKTGYWHYAIGAYSYYENPNNTTMNQNTIPGPYIHQGIHVPAVDLWIRVANFSNMICFDIFTCTTSYRLLNLYSLLSAILVQSSR